MRYSSAENRTLGDCNLGMCKQVGTLGVSASGMISSDEQQVIVIVEPININIEKYIYNNDLMIGAA
jgi:hypothetical protein